MENKLDFQMGDKVTCLVLGKSIVAKTTKRIVFVGFGEDNEYIEYDHKGIMDAFVGFGADYNDIGVTKRTLFHGHNLDIQIKEKKPKRYKWINIYMNHDCVPFLGDTVFTTKEIAKNQPSCKTNRYVTTIQLKPAGEND